MITTLFRLATAVLLLVGSSGLAVAQPSVDVPVDPAAASQDPPKTGAPQEVDDATADSLPDDAPPSLPPQVARPVFRVYFHVDAMEMTAAQTFDAVLGRSRVVMPGGGVEALHLWRGLFARGAFSIGSETGNRVTIADDGGVVGLGIPVTIELRPIEIAAGWRWRSSLRSRFSPYVGGGVLFLTYRETSDFAGDDDETDTTFPGAVAFGGIEAAIGRWIVVGLEGQYRTVKDALGAGGVSAEFGETDLGGVTVRVLVGIRR